MKNIFCLILVFFLVSCELIGLKTNCDEEMEFTQQELAWGQEQDSLFYLVLGRNDTMKFVLQLAGRDKDDNSCPKSDTKKIVYKPINTSEFSRISFFLDKSEKYGSQISFQFNSNNVNSDVPLVGISQSMGRINIASNQPIETAYRDYVSNTKLGIYELNGRVYENVFVLEDSKESEVPQIDIFRFYVNPSGILRIEFYDGEIWDRID